MDRFHKKWLAVFFIPFVSTACVQGPLTGKNLITGKEITLSTSRATPLTPALAPTVKATVVLFLSAKCPCSKSHEEGLAILAKKHPSFQFVGIHSNADEPESFAKKHFEKSSLPFPILQDNKAELADSFRAFKTPHAFIVGPQGECWFDGGVDNSKDAPQADEFYLASALERIEAGEEPLDKKVRTLGCIIKR